MGNSVSKAVGSLSRSKSVVENVADMAKRKVQKEGQQFMASDRAEKVLAEQKNVPKRAPMNLGRVEPPEDIKIKRMKEIEEQQQPDGSFLSLMKDVYLSSTDPKGLPPSEPDAHSGERSESLKSKLPQKIPSSMIERLDAPRGRAELRALIDAMYNHRMNPQDWGPAQVAEKIHIRESDAKDILDNFGLLDGTSVFKTATKADNKK